MKNNLRIEVEAYADEGIGRLEFLFYDKSDNFVGQFEVNRKGVMNCNIYDEKYKSAIILAASQIYGEKMPENLKELYEISFTEDPVRWNRAKEFISQNGLKLKYGEDIAMDYEEDLYNMHAGKR